MFRQKKGVAVPVVTFLIVCLYLIPSLIVPFPQCEASTLYVTEGTSNPAGAFSEVYLLDCDNAADAVDKIIPAAGVSLPTATAADVPLTLRMFHFNDLHNHLTIPNKKRGDTHYFSQMIRYVKQSRQDANNSEIVLFLSAGDDHTGSVFDELLGLDGSSFVADPAYKAYSAAGVDAVVLGNHEFDRGAALLAKGIESSSNFPVLSANIYGSKYITARHYHAAMIGVAKGVRIGIIGLTTSRDTHLHSADDPGLAAAAPVKTLANILPSIAKLADVVIILSHVGYEPQNAAQSFFGEESDAKLAATAAGLTDKPVFIIGGHSHTSLNAKKLETQVNSVPILQAGQRGQFIGEAEAKLVPGKNGLQNEYTNAALHALKKRDNTVKASDAKYPIYEQDADYDINFEEEHIKPLLQLLSTKLDEKIGAVANLAEITTDRTLVDRYVGECALGNFMNDAIVARSATFPALGGKAVDIAAFNASGINSGIHIDGPITFNDWYAVMPFADTIQVAEMTGQQIKEMVINNAKRVIRPDELTGPQPPKLTEYFSRGYLHFSKGLRYAIKLGANANETTAVNITLNGKDIDTVLGQKFKVAFNSFVGEGAFNEAWNGKPVEAGITGNVIGYNLKAVPKFDTGLVYRNEVVAYIKTAGIINQDSGAKPDGRVVVLP